MFIVENRADGEIQYTDVTDRQTDRHISAVIRTA